MSYDYLFKLIFVGDTHVGKTAITDRLIRDRYLGRYDSTIGVDFACVNTVINKKDRIKAHIWDTAGQESFSSIISNYYKGIAGAAIVFDITNACAGMFTGMQIVDSFISAGLIRRGMVVSGEFITGITRTAQIEITEFLDPRLACLTVGDAGPRSLWSHLGVPTLVFMNSTCIPLVNTRGCALVD